MSVSAPRIRLMARALDGIPEEDVTLALSTRSLTSSYKGACVQVRRDPPGNSLVFVSKVDGVYADRLESVAVSASGDVYAVGRQLSATFFNAQGTSSIIGPQLGTTTPCIAKYAANGSPVWLASISGTSSSAGKIDVGNDGNVFVHAYVNRSTVSVYDSSGVATLLPWSATKTLGSPLVKYTSNGDVAWAASVRSEVYDVIQRGVASDQASGAYVCGSCSGGAADTVSSVVMYDSAGVAGATLNATGTLGVGWLGRFNSTGNVLWATSVTPGTGTGEIRFSDIASDSSGEVFVCGDISLATSNVNVMNSNGTVATVLIFPNTAPSITYRTAFVAKYNAAGNVLAAWNATATETSSYIDRGSTRIASDGIGNIYLAGAYSKRNIYHSNNALAGQIVAPTNFAACLVKYDSDLNAVWWTSVDGLQADAATSLAADANGVYLTGTYATTAGGTANIYHANAAVAGVLPATANGGGFIVSYSPSGTVQSWNSTSSGSIEGVALDPVRNRAMIVGYSASGTTANVLNQSDTVLSSITGTGEAGFLGGFQLQALKDIGFKRGSLDTDALKEHCPVGSNGYVQTWYSQQKPDENPNMATATLVSGQRYELLGYFTDAIDTYSSSLIISSGIDNTHSYKAFNKTAAYNWDCWHSAPGLVTNGFKWISFQYPHAVWLVSYTITARNDNVLFLISPYIWAFQGSNDGVNWTSVDSQSGVQFTPAQSRTFPVTSTSMYQYYRLYITSAAQNGTTGGANQVAVGNMDIATIETPLVEEYPPAPMTANTTTLSGQAYGNGDYVVNVSSTFNNNHGWRAFDRGLTAVENVNTWLSAQFTYTSGVAVNTTAIVDGVGVAGEWVQIKLPVSIVLSGYGIMPQTNYLTSRNPFDFTIAGSNDGVTWNRIDTRVSQTGYVAEELKQFSVVPIPTVAYQYYRLIISKTPATGGSLVALGEWRLYSTYSDRNARQYVPENQPLLIQNGLLKTNSTNRPFIDFSGGKSLVIGNDASAAGTPMYTSGTSGLGQSTYTTTISSGEVIGVRTATPTIITNQQYAYGSTPNTLSSARGTIGSAPILNKLSQHAQTSCLAAFSFRRLFLEYKGPVVRLRRESDNAERDFYGCPSAIEIWIGTSSARVVTLWDQSSSNKNATQITPANQPQVAKQFGVYVAQFNGTSGVPHYMTFADIYPTSFWSQYYINALNNNFATLFARADADFGFRQTAMTTNSGDFLGLNTDTNPYWMINGQNGSNNQDPKSVSLQVWNRVTGSRITSAGPINQLGRGYTAQFRDLNGFLGEIIFWSNPALVQDMLLLDASPFPKTTSSFLSQTLNTTIGRLGALVSRGFTSLLNAVQIMSSFTSTSNGPRTGSGSLILNNQNFGNFQYVVKRGSVSINTGYTPTDYFSSVKDTAAAIVVIDGNLTIGAGCIFTPPVRKLFSVLYVKGNLILDGEISMTARGANHNATPGESGFSSVFPAKDILVFGGEFGDLFGVPNAFVPAGGASGGVGFTNGDGINSGARGLYGTSGGSAGGGAGGAGGTFVAPSGSGAAGTAFSGGTGGGGSANSIQGGNGEPNGGLGGQDVGWGGGAGNGPNGTGGTLFVIVSGTVTGSGKVTSHGSVGFGGGTGGGFSVSGGGSGGGSAWLLAGSGGESIKVTATGGDRARVRSGLGGNGSAMKISLRTPLISSSTRSSVVGAYSLRRLLSSWGGPIARIRHGTTNEQRDFYSEDLGAGAALDVFLGGAVAYIHTWYDQSGSNNHATQTTTTNQPWIVRDASWTTKPTVRCGGTGFLTYNGTGLVNTDYTVAVSTARTSDAIENYFMTGTSNTADQNLTLGYRTNTQLTHTQYGTVYNMTISGHASPTPETFMFRHSSTDGKTTHRNGTLLGSSVNVQPLTGYVGAAIGRAYAGDISEVILASSYVSDPERSLLETSMMAAL